MSSESPDDSRDSEVSDTESKTGKLNDLTPNTVENTRLYIVGTTLLVVLTGVIFLYISGSLTNRWLLPVVITAFGVTMNVLRVSKGFFLVISRGRIAEFVLGALIASIAGYYGFTNASIPTVPSESLLSLVVLIVGILVGFTFMARMTTTASGVKKIAVENSPKQGEDVDTNSASDGEYGPGDAWEQENL